MFMCNGRTAEKNMSDTFQFVEIDLIPTVGISATLTRSLDENFVIISSLWKHFNAEIHKTGNRSSSGRDWEKFGITYAHNHKYCYLAAIPYMDNMRVTSRMIRKNIARGRYACIAHSGKMCNLKSTVSMIYKKMLPERNLTPE